MEPADLRYRSDLAVLGQLYVPGLGRILGERQVGASAVVVLEVAGQNSVKVPLVEHDDVVGALPADAFA